MHINILIPSQNQRTFSVEVKNDATVASFRKLISKKLRIPISSFLLIALGKIMIDKCLDNLPATLFHTYRVKDQTSVFVHVNKLKRTPVDKPEIKEEAGKKRKDNAGTVHVIRDINQVTVPFDNIICPNCNNDTSILSCPDCGCVKCYLKTGDPLICDQCNEYWHLHCAGLTDIPTDEYWYCPDCYNNEHTLIVGKGEAMKSSHGTRIEINDYECTIVPEWHAGKIPGIYSGQTFEYRALLHDMGVHRSTRYSICGSVSSGAVSMILSRGTTLDRDVGYEFTFSSTTEISKTEINSQYNKKLGNKRLSRSNLALALTCGAALNTECGAKARDWRTSRPVRVCRTSDVENSIYTPEAGIRYDGLYKLVKYWPSQDQRSSKVSWKFLFRRDDQEPPLWTAAGRGISTKRGLRMLHSNPALNEKKVKYIIPNRVLRLMNADTGNRRLWNEVKNMTFWSEYDFIKYVFDEAVVCSSYACAKPIKDPMTTPCGHICCIKCLESSDSDRCFTCRAVIPPNSIKVNSKLLKVLKTINWAYESKAPAIRSVKTEEDIPLNDEEIHTNTFSSSFVIKREPVEQTVSGVEQTRKRARIVIEYLG